MVHTLIRKINKELKDKINFDERIRECYLNSRLSYDKIAKIVEHFMISRLAINMSRKSLNNL